MGCLGLVEERRVRSWPRGMVVWLTSAVLGLGLLMGAPAGAVAQDVDEQVAALNQQAMDAYNMLEVNRAAELLDQALQIAGGSPEALKRTYMNLAIVHIDGLQNNGPGGEYLVAALCIDPSLQLDPLTSTPNIQAAYAWATEQVAAGACGGATGAAPVDNTATQAPVGPGGPGQLGDECAVDGDCGSGLICREFYCTEGGQMPVEEPEPAGRKGKLFARLGLALGASYLTNGMPADGKPPADVPLLVRGMGGQVFNEDSPWVPDADSADALGPLGGACSADGTATAVGEDPSSYCVRLKSPGLAGGYAIRLAGGFFFTDDFSGALLLRINPDAGAGTLSSLLIGARGEYWLGPLGGSKVIGTVFGGLTVGQIQAQPNAAYDNGPYVASGPIGVHAGFGMRYPISETISFYGAPELVVLFPDFMVHIDLTIAGVEATF